MTGETLIVNSPISAPSSEKIFKLSSNSNKDLSLPIKRWKIFVEFSSIAGISSASMVLFSLVANLKRGFVFSLLYFQWISKTSLPITYSSVAADVKDLLSSRLAVKDIFVHVRLCTGTLVIVSMRITLLSLKFLIGNLKLVCQRCVVLVIIYFLYNSSYISKLYTHRNKTEIIMIYKHCC